MKWFVRFCGSGEEGWLRANRHPNCQIWKTVITKAPENPQSLVETPVSEELPSSFHSLQTSRSLNDIPGREEKRYSDRFAAAGARAAGTSPGPRGEGPSSVLEPEQIYPLTSCSW